ncbi:MAG: hypothetical protein A2X59_00055 [Nitrospirae bacterium GWC2_42_7]|nr:MAG: hypothetical protein A2X59_00055 [Nitrospirae bacterium GWC2_42_7]
MKWDDEVKTSKTISNYQQHIFDILIKEHPEYLRSDVVADILFLERIEQALHIYLEYPDPFEFERDPAEAVLKSLPSEIIKNSAAVEFIQYYQDARNQLEHERFLKETADDNCESANNRANAKAELGRIDEALEDYNQACHENPKSPLPHKITPFFGRARLYLEIGQGLDALKNAEHIFDLLSESSYVDTFEYLSLAELFLQCNVPEKSVICLKHLLDFLTDMLPFTVINSDGSLEYEKDGFHMSTSDSHLTEIISLVKDIEKSLGQNTHLIRLLETVKNDIALWRAKTGI